MRIFTDEMRAFVVSNAEGTPNARLTEMLNAEFGTNLTVSQIKTFKKDNKISSGLTGHFAKGQVPYNKGMKGLVHAGSKKSWFQKGHIPIKHRPIGSERISKDGYIEVKITESGRWRKKQVPIWESAYGKVPKGSVVIFLDGNKLNTSLENLKMVTRSELLIMNRYGFFKGDAELTDVGSNLAKLIDARNKKVKKDREEAYDELRTVITRNDGRETCKASSWEK